MMVSYIYIYVFPANGQKFIIILENFYASKFLCYSNETLSAYITIIPANILHKSIAGRSWSVSYPDGPITAHYRFM